MTYATQSRRTPVAHETLETWTPGDEIEMDALIAACVLVAQADGWVTHDERRRMIERMRRSPTIALFGVEEVLQGFETLNDRLDRDLDEGVEAAETAIQRLAGRAGPSRLLVETACAVAEADGGFDAEERDIVLRLCELLDLHPGAFGVVTPEGARR
ncbi:MAG: tellurite resistance TerB family protein [Phenylobacterium sp.]|jgi:tellurite resistance protein TerB|uniref:tellurite resistance TerB family protein n=1 Tax=Phenylobacterium sp. TaxID=1871053 RepID=UPI001B41A6DA|nr:TerB family tellurite resistance protein [Phenylobacterium sp.]MBP7648661.1 tellurite resistance TerB family protein [Phenylobacterium sp.]MBP7816163.1 tellurite resistance TerB family protein [Phenylobacterium sp.]MBP9231737.1 tellurite resistance TerB family protein [Phenylobacterium sp.]MBP9755427.1 tellurite resistance TerB family protein [Phenylobacterium sp.]